MWGFEDLVCALFANNYYINLWIKLFQLYKFVSKNNSVIMHLTYWCGYWCGYWCDHPALQLSDNQWAVRRVSPTFAISAEACAHTREGRKTSWDGSRQDGLYGAGCQPLDKLGFRQPPSGSCTVQSFSVSLHRHSALRPSTTWLSLTSTSAPQTYRRKRLLF